MRGRWKIFIIIHIVLVALLALFPLYRLVIDILPPPFSSCIMHDAMHLYCPACGGTRAVSSLLRLNILQALGENASVVLVAFVFLGYDIAAFVRLIQKKATVIKIPIWLWIVLPLILFVWFVARNVLLVAFSIDTLGDLGDFWRQVREEGYLALMEKTR